MHLNLLLWDVANHDSDPPLSNHQSRGVEYNSDCHVSVEASEVTCDFVSLLRHPTCGASGWDTPLQHGDSCCMWIQPCSHLRDQSEAGTPRSVPCCMTQAPLSRAAEDPSGARTAGARGVTVHLL